MLSAFVTSVAFGLSLIFASHEEKYELWFENVCIGIFSSGLLLLFSSLIGYLVEEKKCIIEYAWKITELKDKVLNLQTLTISISTMNDYYHATTSINSLLRTYFAIVDNDFFLIRRKKIQKMYEIHYKLEHFYEISSEVALRIGEYRTLNLDENGNRTYPFEKFKKDIQEFINMLDNYEGTGMPMAIWLEEKERAYCNLVFKRKNSYRRGQ